MILNICPNPSIDSFIWIDELKPGLSNRVSKIKDYPGGKGVHVGLALSELGSPAALFSFWGGSTGDWIKKECNDRDLRTYGVNLKENNRKCYTAIAGTLWNNTEILEPGPTVSLQDWEDFKIGLVRVIESSSYICMSGSWPVNVPENAYAQLISISNKFSKNVILDCSGIQLKNALMNNFFGLHINEYEALELCQSKAIEDVLDFLDGKVELLALTKGKEGREMYYKNKIIKAKLELEEVISAVGSGDCLTAGLLYALSKGLNEIEIAKYGVACGAANCVYEKLGMIRKQDVFKLLNDVSVKEYTYG